jgi:purine-nucleoside phosphorylase
MSFRFDAALQIRADANKVRETLRWPHQVEIPVAIILGSGFGKCLQALDPNSALKMPYSELECLKPRTAVQGHANQLVIGTIDGMPVLVFCGKRHQYEGFEPQEVVHPVLLAYEFGVRILIQTSAVGGIGHAFRIGDLAVVKDHLSLLGCSPLTSGLHLNHPNQQIAFPYMGDAYDLRFRSKAAEMIYAGTSVHAHVAELIRLRDRRPTSVNLAIVPGPELETALTAQMLKNNGADVVGMSGGHETVAARALGIRCLSFVGIGNYCPQNPGEPCDHSHASVVHAVENGAGAILCDMLPELVRFCAELVLPERGR